MKKIIIALILTSLFLGCKKSDKNSSENFYVTYAQKIAKVMDEKVKNLDNLDISPYFINDELKKELEKTDYTSPAKEVILILKYSEHGPLPAYIDMEENLSETLKNDVYKKDLFCIFDNFYLNIPTENLPASAALYIYDLFVEDNLLKQPVICILEYEDAYPIIISIVTGENGAVLTNSTILFDKNIDQDFFTSSLAFTNLELDKMYVLPLK